MSTERREVLEGVQHVIREELGLGPETPVPPGADFYAELGGDSLALAEITMELEERFGINVPDDAVSPPITPAKMVAVVEKCLAERQPVRAGKGGRAD